MTNITMSGADDDRLRMFLYLLAVKLGYDLDKTIVNIELL